MKTTYLATIPQCDICHNHLAVCDAPTKSGPWAYMCSACRTTHIGPGGQHIGFALVRKEPPTVSGTGQTVAGIEPALTPEYLESLMFETCDREVECPVCGGSRTLEIDETCFECECGAHVTCSPLM